MTTKAFLYGNIEYLGITIGFNFMRQKKIILINFYKFKSLNIV